jgi:DNA polymerase (family 10)
MTLDKKSAAGSLREIAALLELHDENPHRVRAFTAAARAVERIDGDLADMVSTGEVLSVKGIGKGTAGVLKELMEGRRPEALAQLDARTPAGVKELLSISGLGPKRARTLWRDLELRSVGELEYACRENRLVELPGFGRKSQQQLLEAAVFHQQSRERRLIHQAWAAVEVVTVAVAASPGIDGVEVAGELRRGCETVDTLELVVTGDREAGERALARKLEGIEHFEGGVISGTTAAGFRCRARVVAAGRRAAALLWATGSTAHLEALRGRASKEGLVLDEKGLSKNGTAIELETESEIYERLGCRWVPPELREDGDEVEAAARSALPPLLESADLLGALHNHSTDSDGAASVAQMAASARRLGWGFLGIADHSPAAHYANGLSADRLRRQWQVIDELNAASTDLRVVKGLEADILSDGSLDLPAGCADGLEYAVASVHSSFRMAEEAQTERIVKAVGDPACRILGHPTGRLLLARPPYDVDLERVLAACAEHGVAVEINASPYRLDLDWRWSRRALELGIPLVINPDAHSAEGLEDTRWGLTMARKAGASPEQILNCGDIDAWLNGRD